MPRARAVQSRRISHGRTRKNTEVRQKQKHEKEVEEKTFLPRNDTESKHSIRFKLMNDFQAHGLRSMGLLELATDEHGRKAKNFYREDAKYAKKQQKRLDFLSSFALFASSR